ncbi:MAG: hypothetical protein ISR75_03875 [Phycisphaerales bacterium]|nr:hypothetical protein [Planctomycetota bacterium]MBL6997557.1 hypothetical protein [Phycisphaerales bacterium]
MTKKHFQTLFLQVLPVLLVNLFLQNASADSFTHLLEVPDFDRWMYPFNGSIGDREVASTFSSIGGGYEIFDDRDAQILLGFVTPEDFPTGIGVHRYNVVEATVHISISNEGNVYDPTIDGWQSYLVDGGIEDVDAGRPIELFGAAFRGGFDGWTFGETGPFPFGAVRRERNAYPVMIENGDEIDVSNNVLDQFEPKQFAVGVNETLTPGQIIPTETVLSFAIDVTDPDIQCYLKKSCNEGLISFIISSLHEAQEPGVRNSRGLVQPNFHMKESWAVYFGIADAAQLNFTVVVDDSNTIPEDLDGDGAVGVSDILVSLSDWGFCYCCSSDLNADGEVNVSDLLAIIAAWGS